MADEKVEKTNEETDEKTAETELINEIADIDFEDSLDISQETKTDDTVKDDTKIVEDNKSVEDSKEVSDEQQKEEEDKKTTGEEKTEETEEISEDKKETKTEVQDGDKESSQVDKLLAEIERLSGLVKIDLGTVEDKTTRKEDQKETQKEVPSSTDIYDYIKDLDMDDVASDPAVLNKILHSVVERVQQQTTEQVLRSIPEVVMSQVNQQSYFKKMADKFYDDNKDLINVRQVVRACAQQVQKENPEWELEKVFEKTADRTRSTLGMSAQVIQTDDKIPLVDDVAFAHSKGGSKTNLKPQRSSLQKELDEL